MTITSEPKARRAPARRTQTEAEINETLSTAARDLASLRAVFANALAEGDAHAVATHDGGTCNFDRCVAFFLTDHARWLALFTAAAEGSSVRLSPERVYTRWGVAFWPSRPWQGGARTRYAEALKGSLRAMGLDASIVFAVD